jgi:hypothetical protein
MKYRNVVTYEAPAAAVYAMLVDAEFQARRAEAGKPEHAEVAVEPGPGSGATVRVTRRLAVDLPGFVQKLTGRTVTLSEVVRWPDGTGGERVGALHAAIAGQPASVDGTLRVAGTGGTSTVTMEAEIKVRVPLVGGKVERFVSDMLDKLMATEEKLGRAWLAGAGGTENSGRD